MKNTLKEQFQSPPSGYGEVPFYWWVGEKLDREKLLWQLEQLEPSRPTGLQVNYAHTDQGGNAYGLTIPSDPPLFSDEWWELFLWWAGECNKRGIAVSLSDYTLGIVGQGWWMDEILKEHPDMTGRSLQFDTFEVTGGEPPVTIPIESNTLSLTACSEREHIDLDAKQETFFLPSGDWKIARVRFQENPDSVDPLHPLLGQLVIEKFFQRFEDRMPGQAGIGLNYFFSDELTFGVGDKLWTDNFAKTFSQKKGYELLPKLYQLFVDCGPDSAKLRLDYYDVLIELTEAAYFKPVYDWHHKRGMVYGCDHGGRGRDVVEFGDYFLTQRWMSGPGCDQPKLMADVIKNKVASSIAHLYQRPRVWLEGYHSSGWGTSSAELTKATEENFVSGHNLLSLHGLYYTTLGGWWEWAPPCNHFRMPYWKHMPQWMDWLERISFIMSQGVHRCDVALLYPVSAIQAESDGKQAVQCAFDCGTYLFNQGMDFDFIDLQSLNRAEVDNKRLKVSGEEYQVLIIPAMSYLRNTTIMKMLAFFRQGGVVIALDCIPSPAGYSSELSAALNEIFKSGSPRGLLLENADHTKLVRVINCLIERDFSPSAPCRVNHRVIDDHDVFMITGAPAGTRCQFKITGQAERWNPWNGTFEALSVIESNESGSTVVIPETSGESIFLVFSPGAAIKTATISDPKIIELNESWEFELAPTMDNRWGDFRLPAENRIIGAEAAFFEYGEGCDFNDIRFEQKVQSGFGPVFKYTGPLQSDENPDTAEWKDYIFSWREGVSGDPGHQGYHGLKGQVTDEFLVWGQKVEKMTENIYEPYNSPQECHYFKTWVHCENETPANIIVKGTIPDEILLNGNPIEPSTTILLQKGSNSLRLRYHGGGRGAVVMMKADGNNNFVQEYPLSMNWYRHPELLPFDCQNNRNIKCAYRFTSPPGLKKIEIAARTKSISVLVNGKAEKVINNTIELEQSCPEPAEVVFQIDPEQGIYGGAAFERPVRIYCEPGRICLGDWSTIGCLENYSGGAWYRTELEITSEQLGHHIELDLGEVISSAEVYVNGTSTGIRLAPPWKFSLDKHLKTGKNRLEVLVYNTLSNHYTTIPTRYRGSLKSGLIGPVKLMIS